MVEEEVDPDGWFWNDDKFESDLKEGGGNDESSIVMLYREEGNVDFL